MAAPPEAAPYVLAPGEGEVAPWFSATVTLKASTPSIGISEVLIGPGAEPPVHMHTREDEWFYVLEGEATFHFEGEDVRAPVGSFVFVPREYPHTLSVQPRTRLLVINAPGGEERMFQMAPRDEDEMARMFDEYGLRIAGPHPRDAG